jgi:hypothetical protein
MGFMLVRSKKHETWRKILSSNTILHVRVSHKENRDIPKGTFFEILREMGIDETTFKKNL